jgi:MHS family proline/betaine transporter-like MFS transporter
VSAPNPSFDMPEPQENAVSLRRSVAAGAVGVFVHWFDWAVYAYLATTIASVFFPQQDRTAGLLSVFAVFAVSFGIRPIGALVLGPLGDRIGRRRTLSVVIFIMSGATLTIGLLPGYATLGIAAPVLLVLARLVQGFAAGGEFGSAASFLAEHSPRHRRGFGVSWLEVGSLLGFLCASFVYFLLSTALTTQQVESWGWRIPFLIAAPLGIIGFIIRNKIEDTPDYRALARTDNIARHPMRELLRNHPRQLLQAAGVMTMMHVPFYAVLTFMVTYQTDHLGHPPGTAALISTGVSLLSLILVPVFGHVSDRVGRKPVLIGAGSALLVLVLPAFLLMSGGTTATAVVVPLALGVILSAILGTYAVWSAEIFPTRVRQGGLSIAYSVTAALFAGTVPYVMTVLISATGSILVPAPYLMIAAAVGLIAAATMRETAGSPLLREDDLNRTDATEPRGDLEPTVPDRPIEGTAATG